MLYTVWLVVRGRRGSLLKRRGYMDATGLACKAAAMEGVDRAEVSRVDTGEVVFTCESIESY